MTRNEIPSLSLRSSPELTHVGLSRAQLKPKEHTFWLIEFPTASEDHWPGVQQPQERGLSRSTHRGEGR